MSVYIEWQNFTLTAAGSAGDQPGNYLTALCKLQGCVLPFSPKKHISTDIDFLSLLLLQPLVLPPYNISLCLLLPNKVMLDKYIRSTLFCYYQVLLGSSPTARCSYRVLLKPSSGSKHRTGMMHMCRQHGGLISLLFSPSRK